MQVDDGDVGLGLENQLGAGLRGAGDAGHLPPDTRQHVAQEDAQRAMVLHDRHAAHGAHQGRHTRGIGSRGVSAAAGSLSGSQPRTRLIVTTSVTEPRATVEVPLNEYRMR